MWLVKAQDVRNFSCLFWRHVLFFRTTQNTFKQIFALSAKIGVSGLIDNLSSVNEYFFFVSSAVTIYNLLHVLEVVVIVEKSQILHYLLHSNLILSVIYRTHRQIYSIAVHKEIVLFIHKGT